MGKDGDPTDSAKSAGRLSGIAPSTRSVSKCHKEGDPALTLCGNPSPTREQPPPSGPQTFEFVLVTDAESRRQVRRHAMRQYMRQRRLDGIARLGSSRVPLPRWSPRTTSVSSDDSSSRVEELDGENEQAAKISDGHDNDIETRQQATARQNALRGNAASGRDVNRTSCDPLAYPGAGGVVDPFNSYPVTVSPEERRLINHCKCSHFSPIRYRITSPERGVSPCIQVLAVICVPHEEKWYRNSGIDPRLTY
jgi:hypothetical protein